MSTQVETLNEIEVLRNQARSTDRVLKLNLDGVTHEDSLVQPSPAGNCLNWVLGHLLCIYNDVLPLIGQEPVKPKEQLKQYARGSAALDQGSRTAMDFEALKASWSEAVKRIDAGLAKLSPAQLDSKVPVSPTNNPNETVRSLMTTLMFHQAYHAGQTGILRRIAGKKGAIA